MRKRGLFLRRAMDKFSAGFWLSRRCGFSSAPAPRRVPFEPTRALATPRSPSSVQSADKTLHLAPSRAGATRQLTPPCCTCVAPSTLQAAGTYQKARSYNICSAQLPTCAADVTNVAPHAHRSITRRGWRRENRYSQRRRPRAGRGRGPRFHVSSGDAHRTRGRSSRLAGGSRTARTTC